MLRAFICSFMTCKAIKQLIYPIDTFLDVGQGDLLGIISDLALTNVLFIANVMFLHFLCACWFHNLQQPPREVLKCWIIFLLARKPRGHSPLLGELPLNISSKANLPASKSSVCFAWKAFVFLLFWTVLLDKRLLVNSYFLLYSWDNVSFCSQGQKFTM